MSEDTKKQNNQEIQPEDSLDIIPESDTPDNEGDSSTNRSHMHYLGALAFIGLLLFMAFMPSSDFNDIVTISPKQAIERGFNYIERQGLDPSAYSHKKIEVEKLIGVSELTYLNKENEMQVISYLKKIGIPMQMYRIQYESNKDDVILRLSPSTGSLFSISHNPPPGLKEQFIQIAQSFKNVPTASAAKTDSSSTESETDSLSNAIEEQDLELPEQASEIQNYNKVTQDKAIELVKTALLRVGIHHEEFKVAEIQKMGAGFDYRIILMSKEIGKEIALQISSDVIGNKVYNTRMKLILPPQWMFQNSDIWTYIRWGIILVSLLLSLIIIFSQFSKLYMKNGPGIHHFKYVFIAILATELFASINDYFAHKTIELSLIRFFSRTIIMIALSYMGWKIITDTHVIFPTKKINRLRFFRDGIILGILSTVALMGIHYFLLWVGNKTGLMAGRQFLLGVRILSAIPSLTGFFPAALSIRLASEFAFTFFALIFAYAISAKRILGKGFSLLLTMIVFVAIASLIEGVNVTSYLMIFIGNLVLALFAYFLITSFIKYNFIAYFTSILFYIFITDGYHFLLGTVSPFFLLNGFVLLILGFTPLLVFLHLSFFTPLKEKFTEPIKEESPVDNIQIPVQEIKAPVDEIRRHVEEKIPIEEIKKKVEDRLSHVEEMKKPIEMIKTRVKIKKNKSKDEEIISAPSKPEENLIIEEPKDNIETQVNETAQNSEKTIEEVVSSVEEIAPVIEKQQPSIDATEQSENGAIDNNSNSKTENRDGGEVILPADKSQKVPKPDEQ